MLVTSRWMSCLPMNGPTLGWLKRVSSAVLRAAAPGVLAAMVVPRNVAAWVEWRDSLSAMGNRANVVLGTVRLVPGTTVGAFCDWS
ncbi:hypothetical protein D3C72_1746450 [compost metagenome]